MRIFEVRLKTEVVAEIPHVVPLPRPRNRILPLRKIASIKEEILARAAFFEHFDGIVVDWRYLHDRRLETVQQEAGWIARQKASRDRQPYLGHQFVSRPSAGQ